MLNQQIIVQTDRNGNKKNKYIKKQKIGSGGFAKCYLFINAVTLEKFAAKVISAKQLSDKTGRSKILQQVQLHQKMNHENIVRFYDMFQFQGQVFMILQLCQNNSLKQFIKNRIRITEFQAKCYIHQIIQGIQHIHDKNIIHRDIKLGNIFLNYKMEVKIGDFGLSTVLKHSKQKRFTTCGTPNYIAPQILKQTGHSFQADIWAIGVILYAMLIGKPPFQSSSVQNTYSKIKNNQYQFPKQIPLSSEAISIIKGILDPNPKTRLTLEKIRNHDFLNKNNQNIPRTMPSYTISIPPQSNFLRQYVSQKSMNLLVYPRKLNEKRPTAIQYTGTQDSLPRIQKMTRVVSADKNLLKKFDQLSKNYKQNSTLNRGRYIKALRISSLSKESKRSVNFMASPESKKVIPKSPSKYEEDATQIICYYDMSYKYGIGYLLSSGNYGVIFNDNTSLTKINSNNYNEKKSNNIIEQENYIYYNKQITFLEEIPNHLLKKFQILKICEEKLKNFRKNHILISYKSTVHAKKWLKYNECFIIKMSNGIMQFFWDSDSLTLRGYKWVKWRVGDEEGQGAISQKNFPKCIKSKVEEVKEFLLIQSQNSKRKKI